jgi:hypothetical protein
MHALECSLTVAQCLSGGRLDVTHKCDPAPATHRPCRHRPSKEIVRSSMPHAQPKELANRRRAPSESPSPVLPPRDRKTPILCHQIERRKWVPPMNNPIRSNSANCLRVTSSTNHSKVALLRSGPESRHSPGSDDLRLAKLDFCAGSRFSKYRALRSPNRSVRDSPTNYPTQN